MAAAADAANASSEAKKNFFHHHSVSVPIDIPLETGVRIRGEIPFGPPVIHAEPEKTLPYAPINPVLQTDSLQDHFFNPGASIIYQFDEEKEELPENDMDLR